MISSLYNIWHEMTEALSTFYQNHRLTTTRLITYYRYSAKNKKASCKRLVDFFYFSYERIELAIFLNRSNTSGPSALFKVYISIAGDDARLRFACFVVALLCNRAD